MHNAIKLGLLIIFLASGLNASMGESSAQPVKDINDIACQLLTADKIRSLISADIFKTYFQDFGTRIFYDDEVTKAELVEQGQICKNKIDAYLALNMNFELKEIFFIQNILDEENMLMLVHHARCIGLRDWEISRLVKLLILAYIPEHIQLIRYVHFALQNEQSITECKNYLKASNFPPHTILDYRGSSFFNLAVYYGWDDITDIFLNQNLYRLTSLLLNGENACGFKSLSSAIWGNNSCMLVKLLQDGRICVYDNNGYGLIDTNFHSLRTLAQERKCSKDVFDVLDIYNL